MYFNPVTKEIFADHSAIRSANPSVSFPAIMSETMLFDLGLFPVGKRDPVYDPRNQKATESLPVFLNRSWVQGWLIEPLTDQEKEIAKSSAIHSIAKQRAQRLAASDWTQFNDVNLTESVKAAWAIYRQALRDITEQPDYPWSVEWPKEPV